MKALAPRLVLAALAAAFVLAAPAAADEGSGKAILKDNVTPTMPFPASPKLFDDAVSPGGAPWVIDKGRVELKPDGRLRVRVEGFVIPTPPQNGTNPLPTLGASVYCNRVAPAVATTEPFPFSPDGDARFEAQVMLPQRCDSPLVLLNPRGGAGVYIGSAGTLP